MVDRAAPFISAGQSADRPSVVRSRGAKVVAMNKTLFDDLSERINEALRNSPAQDIEKNIRALMASWLDRMDVVLREDFEVQRKLLEQAQAKLAALEKRVSELEQDAKR